MKNCWIALLLAVCLCLGLTACRSDSEPTSEPISERISEPTASAVGSAGTEQETTAASAPVPTTDWRTERGVLYEIQINDALTVCLSRLEDDSGFAVYDASDGAQIGTLPKLTWDFFDTAPFTADYNGDGAVDIGILCGEKVIHWFGFDPALQGSWPDSPTGAFQELVDTTCYPYEAPTRYYGMELSQFSANEWKLCEELYPKITNLEEFCYDLQTYDREYINEVGVAIHLIAFLHPETRNYLVRYTHEEWSGEQLKTYEIGVRYACLWDPEKSEDKEQIRAGIAAFAQKTEEILAGLHDGMSAYDKYYYLTKTICENADYDYESWQAYTGGFGHSDYFIGAPWAGVMGGRCVCEGYSEAMHYLCQKANLYCTVEEQSWNEVEDGSGWEGHMWNLVKLPSGTYHIDATWADNMLWSAEAGGGRYFMATQEQILEDHHPYDGEHVATGTHPIGLPQDAASLGG